MQEQKTKRKVKDKQEAMLKAEHFCAYQERSQQEVRTKLYDLELKSQEIEEIISELIRTNFINEERFAIAYTLGKFRLKKWGRIKIKHGLRLKKVSDKLINNALKKINGSEYVETLEALIKKKAQFISEKDDVKKRFKLIHYALSKGFEKDLIMDILNNSELKL